MYWKEILSLSELQGVASVAFDGVQKLPKDSLPDLDTLMDWLGQVEYMSSVYEYYKESIGKLGTFLSQAGLQPMIMKGYGCSLNYPNPKSRPCGDIDIWLFGKQRDADKLVESIGVKVNYDNDHHSVFTCGDFTVENHQTIMDANSHKSNRYINNVLEKLALECKNDGMVSLDVLLPSAKFNSIHLLRHMASDFASVKTTLRHVLDWATFVNANDVDWFFVHEVAHNSNMNRFLDALNGICVHYLGYPAEKFPIEERNEKLEYRVLNEILTCEDKVDAPTGKLSFLQKLKYGLGKTKRLVKNRWKYDIVYDESLLDSFIWKARNRWSKS